MPDTRHCDLAILGGGLSGGLIAYALAAKRPELSVRLIEAEGIGGNHVWSFFSDDVAPADRWIVEPFVTAAWSGYDIAFPAHRRTFAIGYNSVTSDRFRERLAAALPAGTAVRGRACSVSPEAVVLADGSRIEAGAVLDARGPADLRHLTLGWQKFVGREVRLARPHGLDRPMVMDATVPQVDGYRFVYLLPFAPDRLLVEDTYYSDTPNLDVPAIAGRIDAYVAARGWAVAEVLREETGVLPVATGGDFEAYWQSGGRGMPKAGLRAGLFHPMTGYSLPDAVALAARIGAARDLSASALHALTHDHAAERWRQRGFYRMLGRMLFQAAEPPERYRVLQRFYRLSPGLIGRFYAGRSTAFDKARLLVGRPPVPIGRAIAALRTA